MKSYPKISIVTPNLNGGKFLENTMRSVLDQQYPNLEYIVIDGGSTDGSTEIIKKYEGALTYWESKPDNGLYHAIQKGFEKSTGEIMGWINSDDVLCFNSLFSVAEIFSGNSPVNWIQGYPTVIDDQNRMVYQRPPVYSKMFFYLKEYHDGRFIQQESTFWRRSLWDEAGGHISQEFRFAGDFELWIRFFNSARLYTTSAVLGSFRIRKDGQLSANNYQSYLRECDKIIDQTTPDLSRNDKRKLKKLRLSRKLEFVFNKIPFLKCNFFATQLIKSPDQIYFDFNDHSFKLDKKM